MKCNNLNKRIDINWFDVLEHIANKFKGNDKKKALKNIDILKSIRNNIKNNKIRK